MSLSFSQYGRFLVVGAIVGVASLAMREALGWAFGDEGPFDYSVTVIASSTFGVLLSFSINRAVTFSRGGRKAGWSKFPAFAAIAVLGVVLAWVFSVALRFGLPLTNWLGVLADSAAYAGGTVLASMFTYPLNGVLLNPRRQSGTAIGAGPTVS